jgi:hypothetical protein
MDKVQIIDSSNTVPSSKTFRDETRLSCLTTQKTYAYKYSVNDIIMFYIECFKTPNTRNPSALMLGTFRTQLQNRKAIFTTLAMVIV